METAIDRCDMDIEGPGDVADRLPFFNEISNQGALVGPQFGRAAEGDAACLGGAPSFLGSGGNQRAFELGDACEHGEHHAPGRRRRIGPRFCNGLKSRVFLFDRLRNAQQLRGGARETVETCDDNDVIGA